VRSQVFEIISLGETLTQGRPGGSQRIQTIVER